jgi:hypothetical protein
LAVGKINRCVDDEIQGMGGALGLIVLFVPAEATALILIDFWFSDS